MKTDGGIRTVKESSPTDAKHGASGVARGSIAKVGLGVLGPLGVQATGVPAGGLVGGAPGHASAHHRCPGQKLGLGSIAVDDILDRLFTLKFVYCQVPIIRLKRRMQSLGGSIT